jgi:hypothetical protein
LNEVGQVQLEKEIYLAAPIQDEVFELSHLSKGNYFIKVSDGASTRTEKFILQ